MRAATIWSYSRRPDQTPPDGDWTTWLVLGGRGAGKTRTGAEWVAEQVRCGARRVALVGETFQDAREVMVDGESGLLAVCWDARPTYEASRHRLVWPCGAEARVFSAEDPDGLRGYQHDAAWSDEIAKWRRAEDAWSNLQLGLRLGERPRQVVTTTPRPMVLLKQLMAADTTHLTRATTYDNKGALPEAFLTEIARAYEGTRLGRQELMGELVEDRAGALWSWDQVEACRVDAAPRLSRVVVAVDPPVTTGADADACGIVVAGLSGEGEAQCAYVIEDASVQGLSPSGWAARVAEIFDRHGADRVIAEANQGGEMVRSVLCGAREHLPVRLVSATRGKTVRAEPVAALYERGLVAHAGTFLELEAEMCAFTGAPGEASPDRLDALVWALTDLMLRPGGTPRIHTF